MYEVFFFLEHFSCVPFLSVMKNKTGVKAVVLCRTVQTFGESHIYVLVWDYGNTHYCLLFRIITMPYK